MIALLFTTSAILYLAYTWLSYTHFLKDSKWAFWVALTAVMVVYGLWLELAKRTPTPEKLFFYGLCWDAVVLAASLVIPLTLFSVKPTALTIVGVLLFIIGVVLVKIGSNA